MKEFDINERIDIITGEPEAIVLAKGVSHGRIASANETKAYFEERFNYLKKMLKENA